MKRFLTFLAVFLVFAQQALAGTVYITEFAGIQIGPQGAQVQVALEPAITDQTITSSGVAAASSAVNASTIIVRIHTDSIICVVSGTAPTATTGKRRMPADSTEYFAVPKGQSWKFSVITCT
jgi:hypothetical protein